MNKYMKDPVLYMGFSWRLWVSEKKNFLEKVGIYADIYSWVAEEEKGREGHLSHGKTETYVLTWFLQGMANSICGARDMCGKWWGVILERWGRDRIKKHWGIWTFLGNSQELLKIYRGMTWSSLHFCKVHFGNDVDEGWGKVGGSGVVWRQ